MVSAEMLGGFQLFEGLEERELVEIARLCHQRSYEKDSVIFTSGGSAAGIYLLKDGEVHIQVELVIYDLEARATIYTVRKGETFGWSALVPPHKFTASARCGQNSEVLTIDGQGLMNILKNNHHIGYLVMRNLSNVISARLAATMVALRHQVQRASASRV
jgi:CRP/FNR family cyclic AMP-dependent transcriptional regulator